MHAIHARTTNAFLADAAARCTASAARTPDLAGAAAALAAVEAQLIAGGIVPAPRKAASAADLDALIAAIESGIAAAIASGR